MKLKATIQHLSIYRSSKIKSLKVFGLTNGVKLLAKLYPGGGIFITNLSAQKDGYGAQIQRVLSLNALASSLNLVFEFSPMTVVERQITQDILSERSQESELIEINEFLVSLLKTPSIKRSANRETFTVSGLSEFIVILFRNLPRTILKGKKLLLRIEDAYDFTFINPNLYSKGLINREDLHKPRLEENVDIQVHLRFVNFAVGTERYLEPSYFYQNLDEITQNLDLQGLPFKIILHSDFGSSQPEVSGDGITSETLEYLNRSGVIDIKNNVDTDIFKSANDCKETIKLRYSNVCEDNSHNPLAELIEMANADFLVLSKSSFAFVAGVLNSRGKVISPIYWNRPLKSWNS